MRYTPSFILQQYEQGNLHGTLDGYALLTDIAGFTSIATSLQRRGKEGAEALSRFLDEVFHIPISISEANGGFVSVFAGDAVCAIFPNARPESILKAVTSIRNHFEKHNRFHTLLGDFDVKIRQTVVLGKISWRIFRNDVQNEYVFYGDTLREMAQLSQRKEDIIFSPEAVRSIGVERFEESPSGYSPRDTPFAFELAPQPLQFNIQSDTRSDFLHASLRNEKPANEIRSAAFSFANLQDIPEESIEETIEKFARLADKYGGFINKLDATDKGLIAIFLFGIPRSAGNTLERICNFALEAIDEIPEIACGISCGSVFAGYIGSGATREYTALGHPVNLSARLMEIAQAGEIIADTYLWQNLHNDFSFSYLGKLNLKGLSDPIRHYRLMRRIEIIATFQESKFIGRKEEIEKLISHVDSALSQKRNEVIYISGDPGIGKSRLAREALSRHEAGEYHFFHTKCDAFTQPAWSVVTQMLRQYFAVSTSTNLDEQIDEFRTAWETFAGGDHEIERIESMIAYLLGYKWPDSVWSLLPASEKPRQLRGANIQFFRKLCLEKPVVVLLDDGQWIDQESRRILQLLSDAEIAPFIVVSPCRYNSDGSMVEFKLAKHERIDIELDIMRDDENVELVSNLLSVERVPFRTLKLVREKSMGNPLFIEQITTYLRENGIVDVHGKIVSEIGYFSTFNIIDIVSSRLDRLTQNVRECVNNASVLGMEFNIQVLSNMLRAEPHEELQEGVRNRIWRDLDEIRYIFSHILIRDIIYQRMITSKLHKLHRIAAEAMERVFAEKLGKHAEEIAIHYDKAGNWKQAIHYYSRAANYSNEIFQYQKSLSLYERGLELSIGNHGKNNIVTAKFYVEIASIHHTVSNYDKALAYNLKALKIRQQELGEAHYQIVISLSHTGIVLDSMGRYDEALDYFKQAQAIQMKLNEHDAAMARCYNNIGIIHDAQGDIDLALEYYQKAYDIQVEAVGENHPETAKYLNNLGIIHEAMENHEKALEQHLKALGIQQKTQGNKHPETATYHNNLGVIYDTIGDKTKALEHYQKAFETWSRVYGENHPDTAMSMINLGILQATGNQPDSGIELIIRGFNVFMRALGVKHPYTQDSLQSLVEVLERLDMFNEAAKYRELLLDEED